jgi:DNA-binding NtrC family response regulator
MAADDFFRCETAESDPQVLAEQSAARAALSISPVSEQQVVHYLGRARRIATSMGNISLRDDLTRGLETFTPPSLPAGSQVDTVHTFDSAVALLDLAGHPHVLGPEAFALVAGTKCAEAAALVVFAPRGTRVIEALGWTAADARAAAAAPEGLERLPIGQRGEEEWALLARPCPDLEAACTFAAIRRLLEVARALDRYRREEQQRTALWPADALEADPDCIWTAEQTVETLAVARRIAPSPLSVLITGETGTGKEMLARAIHRASDRAERPFLPFNCTAVPRDMIESQLFGFRKGAFTGADSAFPGVIRAAAGGTLFLDEIAEIGPELQPKLLRFLESHEIHPLGEPHPIKVDVRIIAATNAAIEQLVAEGRFRDDLFYRLNVVPLTLPPLRERREEIPPLVQHYLRRYGEELRKGRLTVTDETLEYLLLFAWPGNVRQLANEVRRMAALAEPDAAITAALLSPEILASRRTIPAAPEPDDTVRLPLDQPLPAAVDQLEQIMVRRALDQTGGRVDDAARLLGISRKGLFLKRRRWGLSP